jgi:hypothetical protein
MPDAATGGNCNERRNTMAHAQAHPAPQGGIEARNWVSIFAHLVFGAVAAGSYVWLRKPRA